MLMNIGMPAQDIFALLESIWCLSIGLGVYNNDYPKPSDAELPLLSFDILLRNAGPLLPFIPFLLRALVETYFTPRCEIKPKLRDCFVLYVQFTAYRIALYGIHLSSEWILHQVGISVDHLMSDHIVLGASMVAILELEIPFLFDALNERSPFPLSNSRSKSPKELLSFLLLSNILFMTLTLFGAICGDMFYTALYFHPRMQSLVALCIGMGFQLKAWWWLSTIR